MSKQAWFCVILGALSAYIASCGQAKSDDISVHTIQAADGTICYYIVQSGEARGVSCK